MGEDPPTQIEQHRLGDPGGEPDEDCFAQRVDQAGALDDTEQRALAARLQSMQTSGRAQVAILVSAAMDGEPLAEYALRVAEKWQLGRAGRDDGLLILVVPSAAAARIAWSSSVGALCFSTYPETPARSNSCR